MSEVSTAAEAEASMETEEENREEQAAGGRGSHRLVLPEDGYEWRKYGQKFIKNIGKIRYCRSYFKCQKPNCNAKKRAEWSMMEPDNVRVVYDGVHSHSSKPTSSSSSSSSSSNQYNLLTQVFGHHQPTSH